MPAVEIIKIKSTDYVTIDDGNEQLGCGRINQDGWLYLIDKNRNEAIRLPAIYKNTPMHLYHSCGGFQNGLILVSRMGDAPLRHRYKHYDMAGLWGWIDITGIEVIPTKYIYATPFYDNTAIVCQGKWTEDQGKYWCEEPKWGVIDQGGRTVIPFQYDEITRIKGVSRFFLCHKKAWKKGEFHLFDVSAKKEIPETRYYFS